MFRYLRLFLTLYRYWLVRSLEFRSEVLGWSIHSILWGALALIGINVIFDNVQTIAGWQRNQVLILVVIYNIFDSLLWFFVLPSLLSLSEQIRTGRFDFVLTKPVASRFAASLQKFEFDNYPRVIVMALVLIIFLRQFGYLVTPLTLLGFFISLISGFVIFYSLFLVITSTSFWFIKAYSLEDIFSSLLGVGKFPVMIFEGGLRVVFLYLIPVGFAATFPTQFLIGQGSVGLIIWGLVAAMISFLFSQLFWNFAIRHYSSASS